MRFPVASVVSSRDGSLAKDAKLVNGLFEGGDTKLPIILKRPGCSIVTNGMAGSVAQALFTTPFGQVMWQVVDNNLYQVDPLVPSFVNFGFLTSGLTPQVYFTSTINDNYIFLQDGTNGYTVHNNTDFAQVVSPGFPSSNGYTTGDIVPGTVYLDGSVYVMTRDGKIWGSALEDPTTWDALNFLTAQTSPDPGIALNKQLNYIVAFGSVTTQFFFDAGTSPGSPLAPADTYTIKAGCVNGDSVVSMTGTLVWVAQSTDAGISIMMLEGLSPVTISTPAVEKILETDNLVLVRAFGYKVSGHSLYILQLVNSNITLVYDMSVKTWTVWDTVGDSYLGMFFTSYPDLPTVPIPVPPH